MFGKYEEFMAINQQLVCEIVNTSLQLCAEYNNTNRLSEKSDVLEGFFYALSQTSKKAPHYIMNNNVDMAALFQCGNFFHISFKY